MEEWYERRAIKMSMPLKAKQEIQREAFFLEKVGYRKTEDENSIS